MSSRWKFWLITLLALLSVVLTLALGRWQLSRATQKEALQALIESKEALDPLDTRMLASASDPRAVLYRRVTLRGQWVAKHTVYLDNRQMNGKPGLYVLTPLALDGDAGVVVVQRGWVARNFMDRTKVPDVVTPTGPVAVSGRIVLPPSKLYEFEGPDTGRIRQNLDMLSFSAEVGMPLRAVSIQETGPLTDGLLREWPAAATGVEKHYGYAVQWFALSALISILYVWFQIVRRFISPQRR